MMANFWDSLNVILGIGSLLGILMQVRDSFSEHRELRKVIVLLVVGIFIGSLLTSLRGASISFSVPLRPFDFLVGFSALIISFIALTGVFTTDAEHRESLFVVSGLAVLGLMALMFFGNLGAGVENDRHARKMREITIEELNELSASHEARGNYERAIVLLNEARTRIHVDDVRDKVIETRIEALKAKQITAK